MLRLDIRRAIAQRRFVAAALIISIGLLFAIWIVVGLLVRSDILYSLGAPAVVALAWLIAGATSLLAWATLTLVGILVAGPRRLAVAGATASYAVLGMVYVIAKVAAGEAGRYISTAPGYAISIATWPSLFFADACQLGLWPCGPV